MVATLAIALVLAVLHDLAVVVSVAVGWVTYGAAVLIMRAVTREDLARLRRAVPTRPA